MITRRTFIKGITLVGPSLYLSNILSAQRKSLSDQIRANLSKLEIITEKEAGPDYHDPNDAGNLIYAVKNPELQLAPNFKLREFATSGGQVLPYARLDEDLIVSLQELRNYLQEPIIISSGYRTISRNKAVSGSPKSRHLSGDAADIDVKSLSASQLMKEIEKIFGENIGLHAYPTGHVHIDFRGYKARW